MNEPASSMECHVLTLEIQNHPHFAILRCSGRIVHGDGADELLRAAMSQDKRHLQIDLSGVDSIDAGGLGVLAALEKWAEDGNRTIALVNPSTRVRQALKATKLSSVIQVWPAIQSREDVA
jgi:anti-anti-sigma factor